ERPRTPQRSEHNRQLIRYTITRDTTGDAQRVLGGAGHAEGLFVAPAGEFEPTRLAWDLGRADQRP
ncbi:hypothetical protein, partial [Streptomyces broussonetiae]